MNPVLMGNETEAKTLTVTKIKNAIEYLNLKHHNASSYDSTDLAEPLYASSLKYGMDWRIVLAIFDHESRLKFEAVNWKSRDFGIGQVNYRTILRRKIDLGRLLTDREYAVEASVAILSELKDKYAKIEKKHWWSRYHSPTPRYRKEYYDVVKESIGYIRESSRRNSPTEYAQRDGR